MEVKTRSGFSRSPYMSTEREKELTDKVTNIKGVVFGPKGVVQTGIPTLISSNNVVGGQDRRKGRNGGDENDGEDKVR